MFCSEKGALDWNKLAEEIIANRDKLNDKINNVDYYSDFRILYYEVFSSQHPSSVAIEKSIDNMLACAKKQSRDFTTTIRQFVSFIKNIYTNNEFGELKKTLNSKGIYPKDADAERRKAEEEACRKREEQEQKRRAEEEVRRKQEQQNQERQRQEEEKNKKKDEYNNVTEVKNWSVQAKNIISNRDTVDVRPVFQDFLKLYNGMATNLSCNEAAVYISKLRPQLSKINNRDIKSALLVFCSTSSVAYKPENNAAFKRILKAQNLMPNTNEKFKETAKPEPTPKDIFEESYRLWVELTDLLISNKEALTTQEYDLFYRMYTHWKINDKYNGQRCEADRVALLRLISNREESNSARQCLTQFAELYRRFHIVSADVYALFRKKSLAKSGHKESFTDPDPLVKPRPIKHYDEPTGELDKKVFKVFRWINECSSDNWGSKVTQYIMVIWFLYVLYIFFADGFWSAIWSGIKSGIVGFIILCLLITETAQHIVKFLFWRAWTLIVPIAIIATMIIGSINLNLGLLGGWTERATELFDNSTNSYYVISQTADIMSSTSSNAKAITTLKKGDKINVYEILTSSGYAKIDYKGDVYFVEARYISKDKGGAPAFNGAPKTTKPATSYYHSISKSGLNIRAKASASAKVIGTLEYNQEVEVYSIADGFAMIRFGAGTGYVSAKYLTKGKSVKAEATAAKSTTTKPAATKPKTQTSTTAQATKPAEPVVTTPKPAPVTPKANATAAELYAEGIQLAKQFKESEAIVTLKKAVDMGSVDAMYYLGMMYSNGSNAAEGFPLVLKAAEAGHNEATFQVAEMYNSGTGTAKDKAKAKEWYLKADAMGDGRAKRRLRKL